MIKKTTFLTICLAFVFILSGCGSKTSTNSTNSTTGTQNNGNGSDEVTDRTDYVIFYNQSSPAVLGSMTTHQYIVGRPVPEAETIKFNAYFVPWKIYFSQVQRTSLSILSGACDNLTEQVLYIDGWIDLNLAEQEVGPHNLPNYGPLNLKGTVHETVTGTPGTWKCGDSALMTSSMNAGSVQSVQAATGTHTANFSGASNMTSMTVSGADLYLDFSYEDNINFIWPAGTKIEFAPEGTPIPLEPLSSSSL